MIVLISLFAGGENDGYIKGNSNGSSDGGGGVADGK